MSYNAAMPRRRPIRRILKRTGLVVCVLIVVAWGLSLQWKVFYHGDGWFFGCALGSLRTAICPTFPEYGWELAASADSFDDVHWGLDWPWCVSEKFGGTPLKGVTMPLWIPLGIVAIATAFLFHRDRRRIPRGHCLKCGYNLTDNESGICPECGKPIPKRS